MLDFNSSTTLSIPRPLQGLNPFEVDLTLAYQAEGHLKEIATAGSGNALFLVSKFARAYNALGRAYGMLYKEVGSAAIDSRKRRAHIILDLAPAKAKEKGLSSQRSPTGSEDVREAICYSDPDYCAIEEYRAALEAAKELVFIKLQAMRMGYEAVKSIIRGTSSSAGNSVHNVGHEDEGTLMDRALDAVERSEEQPNEEVPLVRSSPEPTNSGPRSRGFGAPKHD
jgi:hypothetical protein